MVEQSQRAQRHDDEGEIELWRTSADDADDDVLTEENPDRPGGVGQPADSAIEPERSNHGSDVQRPSGMRFGRLGSTSGVLTFHTRPRRLSAVSAHQPGSV